MNTAFYIARRMWRGSGSSQGVMTYIAATAVAVSTAVMILTLAVVFGFRREMETLVSRFAAEVTVTDPRLLRSASALLPVADEGQVRRIIDAAAAGAQTTAYAVRGGAIRSGRAIAGMLLKGVESPAGAAPFADVLADGALPRFEAARHKEILIPRSCADALALSAGAKAELLFVGDDGSPRREVVKVCGIYDSGISDAQAAVVLTDIRNVRKINGWADGEISGYEVRTGDFGGADAAADTINERLFEEYDGDGSLAAISARMLHAGIFDWLGTHDVNAAVIIAIMFVVALFNMVTALLILVLERTRTIGILKTLGMSNGDIRRIFLCRVSVLIARGMFWGDAVGVGASLLQRCTHIVRLDAEGYNVSSVPIDLDAVWVAGINIGFAAAMLLLLSAAASIISRISPADAIRYE